MNQTPLSVLVVDDMEENRILIRLLLKKHPVSVTVAPDGLDVLKEMTRRDFNIMLLDLNMPGFSGRKVLKHLERNGATAPYVIAMTASNITIKELNSPLCRDIIRKPLNREDFDKKIRTLVCDFQNIAQ